MNYFIRCAFAVLISCPLCCSGMTSYIPEYHVNISQEKKPKKVDIIHPRPTYFYGRLDDAARIKMWIDHTYPYSGAPSTNLDEQEEKICSNRSCLADEDQCEAEKCSDEALVRNYARARQLLKGGRHSFERIEYVAALFSLPNYAIELLKKEKYPAHKIVDLCPTCADIEKWKKLFNLPASIVARLCDEISANNNSCKEQ